MALCCIATNLARNLASLACVTISDHATSTDSKGPGCKTHTVRNIRVSRHVQTSIGHVRNRMKRCAAYSYISPSLPVQAGRPPGVRMHEWILFDYMNWLHKYHRSGTVISREQGTSHDARFGDCVGAAAVVHVSGSRAGCRFSGEFRECVCMDPSTR